jgi:hypothetical protein
MHPEFCKKLVLLQIEEAIRAGVFNDRVVLEEVAYPRFFVRFLNRSGEPRLLRFDTTDYDFQAMAVEPVSAVTREPLPPDQWMRRDGGNFPSHHMKGGGQFLCITGARDYYTHEGHTPTVTGDRWEKHRDGHRIADVLRHIAQHFGSGKWE